MKRPCDFIGRSPLKQVTILQILVAIVELQWFQFVTWYRKATWSKGHVVLWVGAQGGHNPANFGNHRHCGSGYTMFFDVFSCWSARFHMSSLKSTISVYDQGTCHAHRCKIPGRRHLVGMSNERLSVLVIFVCKNYWRKSRKGARLEKESKRRKKENDNYKAFCVTYKRNNFKIRNKIFALQLLEYTLQTTTS